MYFYGGSIQHCANGSGFKFRWNTKKSNLFVLFSIMEELSLLSNVFNYIISLCLGSKRTCSPKTAGLVCGSQFYFKRELVFKKTHSCVRNTNRRQNKEQQYEV